MTPEVEAAVREIANAYAQSRLDLAEDRCGGALVTLADVTIADIFMQTSTWFGFHIVHTYPYADVYPHFVRHDLSRRDDRPLGAAISLSTF